VATREAPAGAVTFGRFDPARLPELRAWFDDFDSLRTWGGAEFRFPTTPASFRADAKVDEIDSFALVAADGVLAAFGQCYLRNQRCHLGRLAVAPQRRGRGHGTRLIRELTAWGHGSFRPRGLSLFVIRDNLDAQRLYRRLGFRDAVYPEPTPLMANSIYMIADRLHDPARES
jgi:ribosomal protein S18 acetylase RimI-like enzyme